jgi:hypothetical protein
MTLSNLRNYGLTIIKGKSLCAFHNKIIEDNACVEIKSGLILICQDCLIRLIVKEHKARYPMAHEEMAKTRW